MKSSVICTSIEGNAIDLQCRKLTVHPPRREIGVGIVYPFKLGIRGNATIARPLNAGESPWRLSSYLAIGDEVFGETVDGFSGKPVKDAKVKKASGRHKGSFVTVKGRAYAHVEIGVRELLQRKPQDR